MAKVMCVGEIGEMYCYGCRVSFILSLLNSPNNEPRRVERCPFCTTDSLQHLPHGESSVAVPAIAAVYDVGSAIDTAYDVGSAIDTAPEGKLAGQNGQKEIGTEEKEEA
jgi:hypothetical protein